MLVTTASFAMIVITIIGSLILWSNPQRPINRFFFLFSIHIALWLTCVHLAVSSGEDPMWIRFASAVGAFIPLHMWLIRETCFGDPQGGWNLIRRMAPWACSAIGLTVLCFTPWYVISNLRPPRFGLGYFVYMVGVLSLYGLLCRGAIVRLRTLHGVARLELQILLLGVCAVAFAIITLMALRAILHAVWPIHVQPLVLLVLYGAASVAVTTHRVFNARQLVLVATQRIILVVAAGAAAFIVGHSLEFVGVPLPVALFATAAVVLWFAASLNRRLGVVMRFYPEGILVRQAAFSAARETRIENLEQAFCAVLKGWGQSEYALILSGTKELVSGGGGTISADNTMLETMRQLRWVTPERLARERSTPEREEADCFLKKHGLSALVISEGHALTVLAGVGTNATRLPFTYPQVIQLMELASIMEGAFERAHFSVKAQHAEQLATVGLLGASLAHEIRNPLVSIKTFVQLLPTHHQDPAFREKFFRLIGDEVTRIDQLTEQLLDLASPRTYTASFIELHPILKASLDLVATKAVHRNVQFLTEFNAVPDRAFTDASAAKQVMLNLCFNAIQAVELRDGERWIKISTRNTDGGVEMAVEDSGPGISAEIRPRLFQPFQTTKSTGFGLGLAICSDILTNLNATISVDPPVSGRGAAFRVLFPCQPSSS